MTNYRATKPLNLLMALIVTVAGLLGASVASATIAQDQVSEQSHKVPNDRLVNQLPKGHLLPNSAEGTQPASAKT